MPRIEPPSETSQARFRDSLEATNGKAVAAVAASLLAGVPVWLNIVVPPRSLLCYAASWESPHAKTHTHRHMPATRA